MSSSLALMIPPPAPTAAISCSTRGKHGRTHVDVVAERSGGGTHEIQNGPCPRPGNGSDGSEVQPVVLPEFGELPRPPAEIRGVLEVEGVGSPALSIERDDRDRRGLPRPDRQVSSDAVVLEVAFDLTPEGITTQAPQEMTVLPESREPEGRIHWTTTAQRRPAGLGRGNLFSRQQVDESLSAHNETHVLTLVVLHAGGEREGRFHCQGLQPPQQRQEPVSGGEPF